MLRKLRYRCALTALLAVISIMGAMPLAVFADVDVSGPIVVSDWQAMQNAFNGSDDVIKITVANDLTVTSGCAHNKGKTIEIDLSPGI